MKSIGICYIGGMRILEMLRWDMAQQRLNNTGLVSKSDTHRYIKNKNVFEPGRVDNKIEIGFFQEYYRYFN